MRTEKQILKDFEKLGYSPLRKNGEQFMFLEEEFDVIHFDLENKMYYKTFGGYDGASITMAEHKLLHELFEIWGWL